MARVMISTPVGARFGQLVTISATWSEDGHGTVNTVCDCGSTRRVWVSDLRRTDKRAKRACADCAKANNVLSRIRKTPAGTRCANLTTVGLPYRKTRNSGNPFTAVDVVCDCGTTPFTAELNSLLNGNTTSCGCLKIQRCREMGFNLRGQTLEKSTCWKPSGLHATSLFRTRLYDLQNGQCAWPWCQISRPLSREKGTGRGTQVDHNHRCCLGNSVCGQCNRGLVHRECNYEISFADRMYANNPELLPREIREYLEK